MVANCGDPAEMEDVNYDWTGSRCPAILFPCELMEPAKSFWRVAFGAARACSGCSCPTLGAARSLASMVALMATETP